jgi:hypothetical protein
MNKKFLICEAFQFISVVIAVHVASLWNMCVTLYLYDIQQNPGIVWGASQPSIFF